MGYGGAGSAGRECSRREFLPCVERASGSRARLPRPMQVGCERFALAKSDLEVALLHDPTPYAVTTCANREHPVMVAGLS
jgi:hypothetical protein